MHILYTFLAALAVGLVLTLLKMPGGMLMGSMLGACAYNLVTGQADMFPMAKVVAQILAGALIGSGITRTEIRSMRGVLKPFLILMGSLLVINLVCGFGIRATGAMDLLTALMATTPGGISNIPMIASDLGADASLVTVMQFARFILCISLFPSLIKLLYGTTDEKADVLKREKTPFTWPSLLITLAVATAGGLLGRATPIPSGTMPFAMFAVILLKLIYPQAQTPKVIGKLAQCLTGAFVGAAMGMNEIRQMLGLPLPLLILLVCYGLGAWLISRLLFKTGCFTPKESLLASTPAGASDMALISADLGIANANIILMQVMRLVVVVGVFPSLLSFIARLFG